MATIKSFTSLEQSKKLAEILPLDSADMYFIGEQSIINPKKWEYNDTPKIRGKYTSFDDKRIFYPCWSLASLLGVLPKINGLKPILDLEENSIQYTGIDPYVVADNPVDACYDIILKLYELNLL